MSFDEITNTLAGIIKKISDVDQEIATRLRNSIIVDFAKETITFIGDDSLIAEILERSLIVDEPECGTLCAGVAE